MKRGLGSIIDRAPSVRDTACDRTDLDDGSPGSTQKRHESLTEADDGEEIGSKHGFHLREVGFDARDSVIWALVNTLVRLHPREVLTPPGIIDQVIQSPTRSFLHLLFAGIDAFQLIHLQTKGDDVQVRQILNGFGSSCRGENSQALSMELASKGVTDASWAAPVASFSEKIVDGG